MKDNNFWFFRSKLNTVLLAVLIILMIIALRFMFQNKETYLPALVNNGADSQAPQISGNTAALTSFSLKAGQEVSGKVTITGALVGYFNEGSTPLHITDETKTKVYLATPISSTSDWMVSTPVQFTKTIDFNSMPKGKAYIQISADNPSGLPQHERSVWIPIVIK